MTALHRSDKDRRRRSRAGAAALFLLLTGCAPTGGDTGSGSPAASKLSASTVPTSARPTGEPNPDSTEPPAVAPVMEQSPPVSFSIEALDREGGIIETGLRQDGSLEVPPEHEGAPASWYNGSPTPGEAGPAVLLGHVNSTADDSGVFYNLDALEIGDTVTVNREDGSTAVFEVYKSATYPKDDFPTKVVYSPTAGAELRLITCDGFTETTGKFVENLVIYANLTSTG